MSTVSSTQGSDGLKTYIEVMFKYKYHIVLIFVLTVAVAAVMSVTKEPLYQSSTSLLIKQGREYMYVPEINDERARSPTRLLELINAEMQILNSRDLKEGTIEAIGLDVLYPDLVSADNALPAAVERFDRSLTINIIPDAHVVQAFFRHQSPDLAARAVNVLVDQFLEKRTLIYGKMESGFLQRQLDDTADNLSKAREKLNDFKHSNDVFVIGEQLHLLLGEHQKLSGAYRATANSIEGLESKLASIESQIESTPERVTVHSEYRRNKVVDDAKKTILELQMKEQELLTKYREDSRTVESIRGEIAQVEAFLSGQSQDLKEIERTATNPLYELLENERVAVKTELAYLRAEQRNLDVQVGQVKDRLTTLSGSERHLFELEETVQRYESEYQTYVNKLSEAVLTEALDKERNTNVRVIQAAKAPLVPIGIPLKTRLLLAGFIGLCLGVGYAWLRHYFSGTYLSADSVERDLGVPVIANFDSRKPDDLTPKTV